MIYFYLEEPTTGYIWSYKNGNFLNGRKKKDTLQGFFHPTYRSYSTPCVTGFFSPP